MSGNGLRTTLPTPSAMPREEDWLNVAREILGLPECPHLVGDGVCVRCGVSVSDPYAELHRIIDEVKP